jgi:integrase
MVQSNNLPRAKAGDPRPQKTLEDIMGSVSSSPNLREHQRRTIMSALRTVARCLGKPPSDIPGQVGALQKELATANFLQAGISRQRWSNARSLTLKALGVSGAKIMPSRWKHSTFTPAWYELRRACASRYHEVGLSRFMNYCSSNGIEPEAVDGATFAAFRRDLEEQSIIPNPAKVFGATCRLWDSADRHIKGWPAFKIKLAPLPRGYSLDWSTFPKAFQDDVEAFLSHGANRDILSEDFAPSVARATTICRRKNLQQMATALAASGVPVVDIQTLADLVQPDHAREILQFFLNRAGGKATDAIYTRACLLRTVARMWVKHVPDHPKLDKMCRNISRACPKRAGMTERNRTRLRQFDDEKNNAALLGFPAELMRMVRQQDVGTKACLSYATYALAIEILTVAPIRIKNLVDLKIGSNVILPKADRDGRVFLTIGSEEVKNSMDIEFEMPKAASAMILQYINEFRPRISDTPSQWLFPNYQGERRNTVSFGAQISVLFYRHTGLEMNPHLFRGYALKQIELDRPGSAELGRRLLGHHSIATTIRSYSENKTSVAHKHYEDLIESKRRELVPVSPRRGKVAS